MKKILHIIATPRGELSRTLSVSKEFLEVFQAYPKDFQIEELDLFKEDLPDLTVKSIDGKYALLSGKDLTEEHKEAWTDIFRYIHQFLSADIYLISTPMWNFGIPYVLKQYIDLILQPRYLFRYGQNGPEGLVKGKKAAVITSRGGDYSHQSPAHSYDLQEPYLRLILGFIGIKDAYFINAQPMDAGGPQVQKEKVAQAKTLAREAALKI